MMPKLTKQNNNADSIDANQYESGLSRRESLKWLGVLAAGVLLPSISGCSESVDVIATSSKGHWPTLNLAPITAKGYGKDPSMIMPVRAPWPKILTKEQINLVAVLADIIVPRDGAVPSASEVKVPDVIDEWVSAPYERQQSDRLHIMNTLAWINDESSIRFSKPFINLSVTERLTIIDDIAYDKDDLAEEFKQVTDTFSRLRKLVLAAFFCSPEGTKDIGYLGNVPIAGDYPGPTEEAMVHLNQAIQKLGLG